MPSRSSQKEQNSPPIYRTATEQILSQVVIKGKHFFVLFRRCAGVTPVGHPVDCTWRQPQALLVVAKIAISGSGTAQQLADGIDAAERNVRAVLTTPATIYLEPDVYRSDYTPHRPSTH